MMGIRYHLVNYLEAEVLLAKNCEEFKMQEK